MNFIPRIREFKLINVYLRFSRRIAWHEFQISQLNSAHCTPTLEKILRNVYNLHWRENSPTAMSSYPIVSHLNIEHLKHSELNGK